MSDPPQVIPRPPSAQPGPPSPWADLPGERRSGITIDRARAALATPFDAARRATDDTVRSTAAAHLGIEPLGPARESAVIALLFPEGGETNVLLTRRASTLRSHTGEVSFPGGRAEDGETLVEAALRETWEEVGIAPGDVEVIGTLTPMMTFTSAAMVSPFIGLLRAKPVLTANPAEVEKVLIVPLAFLLSDGVHRSERWELRGKTRVMHFFDLPTDIVWGATARMLWELLAKVSGADVHIAPEDDPLP